MKNSTNKGDKAMSQHVGGDIYGNVQDSFKVELNPFIIPSEGINEKPRSMPSREKNESPTGSDIKRYNSPSPERSVMKRKEDESEKHFKVKKTINPISDSKEEEKDVLECAIGLFQSPKEGYTDSKMSKARKDTISVEPNPKEKVFAKKVFTTEDDISLNDRDSAFNSKASEGEQDAESEEIVERTPDNSSIEGEMVENHDVIRKQLMKEDNTKEYIRISSRIAELELRINRLSYEVISTKDRSKLQCILKLEVRVDLLRDERRALVKKAAYQV
ncbi:unnamed protein product [Moneuplotes crassus]|uniref:Uncharacterized protein n=1 Tax=Euplotes crassus TaxID=5936 RepID=A0AAD2D056_EUPCR|nr:unnamed protein product [Moneuplotes crassus]